MEQAENSQENESFKLSRKSYSAKFKLDILNEIATKGNMAEVCNRYKLNYQMVTKWKKATNLTDLVNMKKRKIGVGRKPVIEDLEKHIYDWIIDRRSMCFPVTRANIQKFAADVFDGEEGTFKASSHWLDRFMQRKGKS